MTNKIIIGVDEVARGCLVGPVVACAVVLKPEVLSSWTDLKDRPKITDSKRMTPGERAIAEDWLRNTGALAMGIGEASVDEIAELNIRNATFLAMNRAISTCLHNLNLVESDDQLIKCVIDGNAFRIMPGFETEFARLDPVTEIKADLNNPSVACASILAKEYRDRLLDHLADENPKDLGNYGWATNRGYGTKDHFAAILREGLCVHHRLGFLGSILHKSDS
jgi:ribonuclease HII